MARCREGCEYSQLLNRFCFFNITVNEEEVVVRRVGMRDPFSPLASYSSKRFSFVDVTK